MTDQTLLDALDRMDALLDPATGLLTVSHESVTAKASRADMQLIRARLAQPEAEPVDQQIESINAVFDAWRNGEDASMTLGLATPPAIDGFGGNLDSAFAPVLRHCACEFDGDTCVTQCKLHAAHVDAIREWAERAKEAEEKLAAQPAPAPVVPDGWVMAPRDCTDDIAEAIAMEAGCCGGIAEQIWRHAIAASPPAPAVAEPLTDEQIMGCLPMIGGLQQRLPDGWKIFARAIEQAHGIGTQGGGKHG